MILRVVIYLMSITRGVLAQSPEPEAHDKVVKLTYKTKKLASSEFQKPRAPGHEFGIKNNLIPNGDTGEMAVPVEFVPIFFV